MNTLLRWLIIAFALLLVITGAFFIIRNFHAVSLDLVFVKTELPLIFVLLLTFILGVIFSWLLNAWALFVQKRKIKQLNKQLADYQQEISQLRQSPMNRME